MKLIWIKSIYWKFKNFCDKSRPKTKENKDRKLNTFDSVSALHEARDLTLNDFRIGIFPIK